MKKYNKPELNIETILLEDIILASGEGDGSWTSDRVGGDDLPNNGWFN